MILLYNINVTYDILFTVELLMGKNILLKLL